MKTSIRSLLAIATAWAIGIPAAWALPTITAIEVLDDANPAEGIPRFTGETFTHPNLGADYTVPVFGEEAACFIDRNHQWNGASTTLSIPQYLAGAEYIQFGNNQRDNDPFLIQITLADPSDVYLLIDNRHPDGVNTTPPNLDFTMLWVTEDGWQPVRNGLNRRNNAEEPDEVGMDEGADGVGPGVGINQWSSVYHRRIPAGTFTVSTAENSGRNMYGVVVRPLSPVPFVSRSSGDLLGVVMEITDGTRSQVAPSSLRLSIGGEDVTSQIQVSKSGDVTRIRYQRTLPFPSLTQQTAVLAFDDTATPAVSFTESFSWTPEYYATLTADHAAPAGSVNTASSGFTARVVQARDTAAWPGGDLPNNTRRAELQLAGLLRDPISGNALANYANPGPNPDQSHTIDLINWNQELNDGGTSIEIGNFQSTSTPAFADTPIPGIPGTDPESTANLDSVAAEIIGHLELSAGLHRLGVNSDDGFRVTAGSDPRNPANVLLGEFNGGRGSSDTLFYVLVETAGIYPVRLLWYEGGGGANVEFFSVLQANPDAALQLIPINARGETGALTSYATTTAALPPAASVYPLANASGVPAHTPIQAVLIPRGSPANPASVQLTLNGAALEVTTVAGQQGLVVEHVPANLWPSASTNTAQLSYADGAGNTATVTWQFTVEDYSTFPIIPASFAASAGVVNTSSSGFLVDAYQMDDFSGSGVAVPRSGFPDNNSIDAAEHQILRRFIDPNTTEPYGNLAAPGEGPGGLHAVELVNWNQDAPANAGDFNGGNALEDALTPGLYGPGDTAANYWLVTEAVSWVELKKGRHRLGVNSDDGFKVSAGANPRDVIGVQLGAFNGGRGAANTFFNFIVEQDGIYPIRLLYWQGTGGASAEFKSQNPTSEAQTLVNDRSRAEHLKAYPLTSGTPPARITAVSPVPGFTDALPNDPISVTFENLAGAAVTMTVNGTTVTPQSATSGNLTTLTYTPTAPLNPGSTVQVAVTRSGGTSSWSFSVRNAPSVAITAPADNAVITTAPANVTVTATASIVGATITKVEFFDGAGAKLGEDTSAPYEWVLNGLTAGRYAVSATATDSRGLVGTSSPVKFRVGSPIVAINFQDASSEGFEGYLPDLGDVFADRGNGYSYGWAEDITAQARNRNNPAFAPDERYDTFNHASRPSNANFWEIEIPNGRYTVFAVAGEASNFDSVYHIQAEGVTVVQGTPNSAVRFYEGSAVTTVTDGRLSLANGTSARNNKFTFVEIYPAPSDVSPPELAVGTSNGTVSVTWSGGGMLESAPAVTGPWTPTGNSSGSYSEPATADAKYFRVTR
jgi:hypothetical protein